MGSCRVKTVALGSWKESHGCYLLEPGKRKSSTYLLTILHNVWYGTFVATEGTSQIQRHIISQVWRQGCVVKGNLLTTEFFVLGVFYVSLLATAHFCVGIEWRWTMMRFCHHFF